MKELWEEDPGGATVLRVGVAGGGCGGFQYTFEMEEAGGQRSAEEAGGDRVFEQDGVRVVVDEVSFSFLEGATLDFTEDLIRSSFAVVENPNTESGCGCGSSFSIK